MKIIDSRGEEDETYWPDEIMEEEIMSRLPTKSLVRFRSVGKQWLSMISGPRFVQSHLKHVLSDLKHNQITFITPSSSSSEFHVLNLRVQQLQPKYKLPVSEEDPGRRVHLMGSCHGLICLGIYTDFCISRSFSDGFNPILWNPILNDYKKVDFFVPTSMMCFGFGYDSHTQDYKLVRLVNYKREIEVYALKSSSLRNLPFGDFVITPGSHCYHHIGRYMNGSLYWLHSTDSGFGFIVFNLRYEKLRFLKHPNNVNQLQSRRVKFSNIVRSDRQLDVFFYDPKNEFFNLVTMEQDSANGNISWSSIIIQHPLQGKLCWPICCLAINGDIVMKIKEDDEFPSPGNSPKNYHHVIFSPQQRMINNIAMVSGEDWPDEYTTYTETLVLPSNISNCSAP